MEGQIDLGRQSRRSTECHRGGEAVTVTGRCLRPLIQLDRNRWGSPASSIDSVVATAVARELAGFLWAEMTAAD